MTEDKIAEQFEERWPEMFSNVYCGFWLPKGWKTILWEACEKIEPLVRGGDFKVAQVKEKFGGLCFYVDNASDEVRDIISEVEELSCQTCQHCGAAGKLGSIGRWSVTLCDACRTTNERKRNQWAQE